MFDFFLVLEDAGFDEVEDFSFGEPGSFGLSDFCDENVESVDLGFHLTEVFAGCELRELLFKVGELSGEVGVFDRVGVRGVKFTNACELFF